MNKLFILIGASGSGKTTATGILEEKYKEIKFIFPDKERQVPTKDEMIKEYGSVENWQKNETINRFRKIKELYLSAQPVFIDMQSRCEYIINACKILGINNYKIILFHCSNKIREERLINRNQSELVNQEMNNWADFLKKDCSENNCDIIDTSDMNIESMVIELEKLL